MKGKDIPETLFGLSEKKKVYMIIKLGKLMTKWKKFSCFVFYDFIGLKYYFCWWNYMCRKERGERKKCKFCYNYALTGNTGISFSLLMLLFLSLLLSSILHFDNGPAKRTWNVRICMQIYCRWSSNQSTFYTLVP